MHTYQQSHWQLEAENKQPQLDMVGPKAKEDIGVGKRLVGVDNRSVGGRREGECDLWLCDIVKGTLLTQRKQVILPGDHFGIDIMNPFPPDQSWGRWTESAGRGAVATIDCILFTSTLANEIELLSVYSWKSAF